MDKEHVSMFKSDEACLAAWVQAALMCLEQQQEVFAAKHEARAAFLQVNISSTAHHLCCLKKIARLSKQACQSSTLPGANVFHLNRRVL